MGIFESLGTAVRRLFESETQRKMRRAQAIRRSEATIERARRQYESHSRRYREKAIEALRIGSQRQYERFRREFKRCLGAARRLSELQLFFSGLLQRAEEAEAFKEFCYGMASLSKVIREATKEFDLSKALEDFQAAAERMKTAEVGVDEIISVMDHISLTEGIAEGAEEFVTDEEVDRLLQKEAALAEHSEAPTGLEKDISEEMKKIDELRRELGK